MVRALELKFLQVVFSDRRIILSHSGSWYLVAENLNHSMYDVNIEIVPAGDDVHPHPTLTSYNDCRL